MSMKFPSGHTPRLSDFSIDGILDETLREGSERCMFSIETESKLPLIRSILKSGIKDLIFGSGPRDPADLVRVLSLLDDEGRLTDQRFSFILLLNCFEPLMEQFERFPDGLKKYTTISFGMVTHDSGNHLFERTVDRFRRIGFDSFRVSILNSFQSEIDDHTYGKIVSQIERSHSCGIDVVRINDSLGTIYPEAMAVLAANLTRAYPTTNFCLHAHNDLGFGLQNALTSIYHGFNMIEGGFAEFGNRSGLPAIEVLQRIFVDKNITIANGGLDRAHVAETARIAEETFLVMPDLFRPVSGQIVVCENMGVTNIPDYLGESSAARYFLNKIGLHTPTLEKIFIDIGVNDKERASHLALDFRSYISDIMQRTTAQKSSEYQSLRDSIVSFYDRDVLFSDRVYGLARDYLGSHPSGS